MMGVEINSSSVEGIQNQSGGKQEATRVLGVMAQNVREVRWMK